MAQKYMEYLVYAHNEGWLESEPDPVANFSRGTRVPEMNIFIQIGSMYGRAKSFYKKSYL